jgi:hypothetical protein
MILQPPLLPGTGGSRLLTFTAGENLLVGDVLAFDTLGRVVKAQSSFASNIWRVVGISTEAVSSGADVQVATVGSRTSALFGSAPSSLSNGAHVFLSSTLGQVALAPSLLSGHVVHLVGVLQGANGVTLTPDILLLPQYISRRP